MNSNQLLTQVDHIEAVALSVGEKSKYRIEAVLKCGAKVVLKKESTRIPKAVQLYNHSGVNGNAAWNSPARYFGFTAKPDSWHTQHEADKHLKSYEVVAV